MLATYEHPRTHIQIEMFAAAAAGISNVRFTYSFTLITSNPFPSLSDLFGSQQQHTHLQELILVFVFSFDFVHASHLFFVLPSLATFLTALYMRWHGSLAPLFFRLLRSSSSFSIRFGFSLFSTHKHPRARSHTLTHTPRFSSHFSDCQILYPILTAINDKRYDAAIKPSRLHITVAIKTMILSTTSIFVVVCVCVSVYVWFLFQWCCSVRWGFCQFLCCVAAHVCKCIWMCIMHDTQHEMGTVYLLFWYSKFNALHILGPVYTSIRHTFGGSIVRTLARRFEQFSLFICTQHLVHNDTQASEHFLSTVFMSFMNSFH